MSLSLMGAHTLSIVPQPGPAPKLDVLMLTAFLLAFAQLACFATRRRSRDLSIGLCVTSLALAVYAIVAGAWPLAMMQIALCGSSALRLTRRFRSTRRQRSRRTFAKRYPQPEYPTVPVSPSRLQRMFGEPGSIN